jgi:hypothetical protein
MNVWRGFDDHRHDMLFPTMPIFWKGTLAQYLGRLYCQLSGRPRFSPSTMLLRCSLCWRAWQQSGERDIGSSATQLSSPSLQQISWTIAIAVMCRSSISWTRVTRRCCKYGSSASAGAWDIRSMSREKRLLNGIYFDEIQTPKPQFRDQAEKGT